MPETVDPGEPCRLGRAELCPHSYTEALTPRSLEGDLIWKQGCCRSN